MNCCWDGWAPTPLLVRRDGRDIKKNVAKPPCLERTGWSLKNNFPCGPPSAPLWRLRAIFLPAQPPSSRGPHEEGNVAH